MLHLLKELNYDQNLCSFSIRRFCLGTRLAKTDIRTYDLSFSILLLQMFYPFLHNKTFITVNTEGLSFRPSAQIGNFLNPAYAVNHFYNFDRPASFVNRVMNILYSIVEPIVWYYVVTRPQQVEVWDCKLPVTFKY